MLNKYGKPLNLPRIRSYTTPKGERKQAWARVIPNPDEPKTQGHPLYGNRNPDTLSFTQLQEIMRFIRQDRVDAQIAVGNVPSDASILAGMVPSTLPRSNPLGGNKRYWALRRLVDFHLKNPFWAVMERRQKEKAFARAKPKLKPIASDNTAFNFQGPRGGRNVPFQFPRGVRKPQKVKITSNTRVLKYARLFKNCPHCGKICYCIKNKK